MRTSASFHYQPGDDVGHPHAHLNDDGNLGVIITNASSSLHLHGSPDQIEQLVTDLAHAVAVALHPDPVTAAQAAEDRGDDHRLRELDGLA
jgi:hypothetical protein